MLVTRPASRTNHLEISDKATSLVQCVVTVKSEVHVGLGISRNHSSANHLHQVLNVGRETSNSVHRDDKGQENGGDDDAEDKTPPVVRASESVLALQDAKNCSPRKTRVAGVHGRNGHGEACNKHSDVPPHGYLLVHLHLSKMRVVALTRAVLLDNLDDLLAVPQQHMGDCGTNGHVPANLGYDLRRRKPRETNLRELVFVEKEVLVED